MNPDELRMDRRGLLKIGMLGGLGLCLSDILRLQARSESSNPSARRMTSVIILHMRGGPSQLETWDMKPDAPADIRGEFKPIATKVPGIQICELLPQTARIMDKWSIVRSLQHLAEYGDVSHSRGDQVVFTGHAPGANDSENAHPSMGSVVARQLQHLDPAMPAYVMVPRMIPGTGSAYLGRVCQPFETMADPAAKKVRFEVPNLGMPRGVSVDQVADRRRMLGAFDRVRREVDGSGMFEAMDSYQRQAWEMVTGPRVRQAFDFEAEPQALRDRYGYPAQYTPRLRAGGDNPGWNQRLLLARRLVEAGVRLVTVDLRWWDTHDDNFWALKNGFLPPFDQSYSALIEDLDQRGLLDTTMVVAWGEHGRTPRVNATAGRDHWMSAFSAAMAGGGIKGGRVVGSTDSQAAIAKDNPKYPQDVLATVYRHLGVDSTLQYLDHSGRPHPVLPFGKPIDELF
ncbi:DUF1501 domain-containing protein [Zavarzinella formosa]|uniref:DUF1501 domain-containing protein n=1 Tax=Zavarzinella formosa TaxID=360055 RepID=UPI00037EB0C9|nr:DUF1501 domain-containing protein [Zavarzinella formosa]